MKISTVPHDFDVMRFGEFRGRSINLVGFELQQLWRMFSIRQRRDASFPGRGVCWSSAERKWLCCFASKRLGSFSDPEDASSCFDAFVTQFVLPPWNKTLTNAWRDAQAQALPDGTYEMPVRGQLVTRVRVDADIFAKIFDVPLNSAGKTHVYFDHEGRRRTLHSLVMGDSPRGLLPIHLNGNLSDYRRINLEYRDASLRHAVKRKRQNATSRYKNVWWSSRDQGWRVTVSRRGKRLEDGPFKSEERAAWVADKLRDQLYGDMPTTEEHSPNLVHGHDQVRDEQKQSQYQATHDPDEPHVNGI